MLVKHAKANVTATLQCHKLMRKDTDKDGKLSLDELGKRMADFAEDADTNGDGLISFEEAKEAMKSKD